MNRIEGSDNSRKSLACPLKNSSRERVDCERFVDNLYFAHQLRQFVIGNLVSRTKAVGGSEGLDAPKGATVGLFQRLQSSSGLGSRSRIRKTTEVST